MPLRSFFVIAVWITVEVEAIDAESVAATRMSAASIVPCVAPVNSMNACASVLTLFDATTAPPDAPLACHEEPKEMSMIASATFSLPVVEVIDAACVAVTARLPVAWISESRM